MQSFQSIFAAAVLAGTVVLPTACDSSSPAGPTPGGVQDGSTQSTGDATSTTPADAADESSGDGDGDGAAPPPEPPQANIRIVHLSPDAPAIDVCLASHGTTDFQGPLLGPLALMTGASDASTLLAYSQVTAYFTVDAGTYDVRVVAAGAADCSAPLALADGGVVPDTTNLPSLAANSYTTIMAVGDVVPSGSDASFSWSAITDDPVLVGGAAVLRVVNAQPSVPAEDFGLGSFGASFLPLFTAVPFGAAGSAAGPGEPPLDSNGYLAIAPFAPQTVSAHASSDAGGNAAIAYAVTIDQGSVATLFAIGGDAAGARPAQLLRCIDNERSGGPLADCSVAP